MNRIAIIVLLIGLGLLPIACSSKTMDTGKTVKSTSAGNNLTVSLSTDDGILRHGNTEFTLTFTDSSGKPVEVGAVGFTFHMPQMGTMHAMNNAATFTTTDTPGVYRGKANIEMAGEWQAQITYDGAAGRGQATVSVNAQ